jgi:hypothetical protein
MAAEPRANEEGGPGARLFITRAAFTPTTQNKATGHIWPQPPGTTSNSKARNAAPRPASQSSSSSPSAPTATMAATARSTTGGASPVAAASADARALAVLSFSKDRNQAEIDGFLSDHGKLTCATFEYLDRTRAVAFASEGGLVSFPILSSLPV